MYSDFYQRQESTYNTDCQIKARSTMCPDNLQWTDYFSGGVPTGAYFKMTIDQIKDICESHGEKYGIDLLNELCLIGLVAYSEAFFKYHFASIINIVPDLIEELKRNGQDTNRSNEHIALPKRYDTQDWLYIGREI